MAATFRALPSMASPGKMIKMNKKMVCKKQTKNRKAIILSACRHLLTDTISYIMLI
ncbi:hypothetical protein D051_5692 [Vibrio parahaemolyticus VPCR-2010]|nr:hypothetical protein D051_5692 [Vibrio parahaemolyticus VPCR-2010]